MLSTGLGEGCYGVGYAVCAVHLQLVSSNAREHGEASPIAPVHEMAQDRSESEPPKTRGGPDGHRQRPRRACSRPQLLLWPRLLERLLPAKASCRSLSVAIGRYQVEENSFERRLPKAQLHRQLSRLCRAPRAQSSENAIFTKVSATDFYGLLPNV